MICIDSRRARLEISSSIIFMTQITSRLSLTYFTVGTNCKHTHDIFIIHVDFIFKGCYISSPKLHTAPSKHHFFLSIFNHCTRLYHCECSHLPDNLNAVHETGVKCHLALNYSRTNLIKIVARLSVDLIRCYIFLPVRVCVCLHWLVSM